MGRSRRTPADRPPQAAGRAGLAVAVVALAGWVVTGTWLALVPFLVGAVLAYACR